MPLTETVLIQTNPLRVVSMSILTNWELIVREGASLLLIVDLPWPDIHVN